jgi:hypothetical protein
MVKMEIVTSTIAVIFDPLTSAPSINERDLMAVLRRPLGIAQTPDGQFIVSSNRDQAEVILGANKLDVRDLSGEIANAKARIPQRLSALLKLISNPHLKSFGINFIVEFAVAEAQKALANNLLKSDTKFQSGAELRSDSVSLMFQHSSGKAWTLRFDSRDNQTVSLNFNASEQSENLPGGDELGLQLESQHQQMVEYVKILGLVPND